MDLQQHSPSDSGTPEAIRTCNKCGETYPIESFPPYGHQPGRRRQCKGCRLVYRRGYYQQRKRTGAREKDKQTTNRLNRQVRLEVVAAYGGVCECCGETEPYLLNVDHINNDGMKERKELGMFSQKLHYFLRRNGFPKDRYQLLCVSCNMGKAKHGQCPHITNGFNIVEMARRLLLAA
jgi:hypothetical protein